jgi:hypothetical protein
MPFSADLLNKIIFVKVHGRISYVLSLNCGLKPCPKSLNSPAALVAQFFVWVQFPSFFSTAVSLAASLTFIVLNFPNYGYTKVWRSNATTHKNLLPTVF